MIPGLSTLAAKIAGAIGIKGFVAIGCAAALVVCWWGWSNAAVARDEAKADLRAAEAELELLKLDAELKEAASQEREADNAALSDQERELHDARTHEGDDAATRRIRRLCLVMRQQGRVSSDIPACQRLGG